MCRRIAEYIFIELCEEKLIQAEKNAWQWARHAWLYSDQFQALLHFVEYNSVLLHAATVTVARFRKVCPTSRPQ